MLALPTRKVVFFGLVPVVLLVIASTGRLSISSTPSTPTAAPTPIVIATVAGECQYTVQQLQPTNCVELSFVSPESLDPQICSSSSVQIDVSDVGEVNPVASVVLSFPNPVVSSGIIIPGGNHTVGGQVLNGTAIEFNQYVAYSPSTVTLSTGETAVVTVTMALPCGLSPEIVGQTGFLAVSPSVTNAPSGGMHDVGVDDLDIPVAFQ